jgi:large subunit ribosomal protein L17
MVTLAKRGTPHAKMQARQWVQEDMVMPKLFDELAKRFASRPGGYTRVLKAGNRLGDNAEMA